MAPTDFSAQLDDIRKKLDVIDKSLRGDGDKKIGMVARVTNLEQLVKSMTRLFWIVIVAAVTSLVTVLGKAIS